MIVLIPALFLYCVKLYSMDTCTLAVFYDSMMNMRVTSNDKMLLLLKEACNFSLTAQKLTKFLFLLFGTLIINC